VDQVAFLIAFFPCLFEGLEMSMFSMLAISQNRVLGNFGTFAGVATVFILIYATYIFLPLLINDEVERIMKLVLGSFFLIMGTGILLFNEHRSPKGAFLTAAIGIAAEGIEVDLFQVSSFLITGHLLSAILGGVIGFGIMLIIIRASALMVPERIIRGIAIVILYTIGFIILTSGLT
jgi:uncharacterized membrane protein